MYYSSRMVLCAFHSQFFPFPFTQNFHFSLCSYKYGLIILNGNKKLWIYKYISIKPQPLGLKSEAKVAKTAALVWPPEVGSKRESIPLRLHVKSKANMSVHDKCALKSFKVIKLCIMKGTDALIDG